MAEAAEVLEMRQILWPSTPPAENPEAEVRVWASLLAADEPGVVVGAMQSFAAESFAPTLGQVREAISPTPTYATALDEFRRMLRSGYSSRRWQDVPWSHPLIAAFAERHFAEWGESPDGSSDASLKASEAAARAHFRESFAAVRQRWSAGQLGSAPAAAELESRRQIGGSDGVRDH